MANFIECHNLSYSYSLRDSQNIPALSDINIHVGEGEFVAIIGHNGSGKSTLGKHLNALLIPDSGNVFISGMNTRDQNNHANIRSQVGMVFQRPQDQVVATTVVEDVAFGPGNLGLPANEIRDRVEGALRVTGLSNYSDRLSYLLSAGETQRLALAGVLAMQPRCIIFDETTAMLDPPGREMVIQQAKMLHKSGKTIVMITHLMDEAAQADRILVLHKGRLVMDGPPRQIFSSQAPLQKIGLDLPIAVSLGNRLHEFIPEISQGVLSENEIIKTIPAYKGKTPFSFLKPTKVKPGENVIFIEDLRHIYLRDTPLAHSSLKGANLSVKKGSAYGLIGFTGSGKSTLLQHINGLIHPQSGKVIVLRKDLGETSLDVKTLRGAVGLVFQQPENQIFEQYVGDEVAFAARNFGVPGKISDIVRSAMQAVGLEFEDFKDRFTSTLSGGEQRKTALASVLAGQPEILLLDEPLAGLDPQSRTEISKYLRSLNQQGMTMLIATHQFEGILEIMDEISVLADGRDIFHGNPSIVFSEEEYLSMTGMRPPISMKIANELRRKGWPIPSRALTADEIIQSLRDVFQMAAK